MRTDEGSIGHLLYTPSMRKAARGIIIENGKILVMHRSKNKVEYFTLVGGKVADNESVEQALVREVKEETGMDVTSARLVFIEEHPEPYNEQFTFLCEVAPHAAIGLQDSSEEAGMNKLQVNMHQPQWVPIKAFTSIHFRTPLLQKAIIQALAKGFPDQPVKLQEVHDRPSLLRRTIWKLTDKD